MTASLFLANLTAYSAQVVIVSLVGGILVRQLRSARPTIRYGSWRLLLLLCLALPFLQSPQAVDPESVVQARVSVTTDAAAPEAARDARGFNWNHMAVLGPVVLLGGAILRLAWIALVFCGSDVSAVPERLFHALDAVSKWEFAPTLDGEGRPTPVIMAVTVPFTPS